MSDTTLTPNAGTLRITKQAPGVVNSMTAPLNVVLMSNSATAGAAQPWLGGAGVLVGVGTFNGATITLQYLGPDGVTWISTTFTLTANGLVAFTLPQGKIQVVVSVATPSAMFVNAIAVPNNLN